MRGIFKKPYLFLFIGIFILYLVAVVLLSGFYSNLSLIIYNFKTINWLKLGVSFLLTLLIGLFVAANSVYLYMKHKERKTCGESATLTAIGTVGGLAVGACPLCVTGLFH